MLPGPTHGSLTRRLLAFCRPYKANEVFVTGTFDDWGKTVKLDQKGDIFEKEVHLPVTGEKVYFKVCHTVALIDFPINSPNA